MPDPPEKRPRYRLLLEAHDAPTPPALRLRALLKRAWRTHRLRCLRVEEVAPPVPPDDEEEERRAD